MKTNWFINGIYGIAVLLVLTGCTDIRNANNASNPNAKTYAIITKSKGNRYSDLTTQGFQKIIEKKGGNCIISSPDKASVEAQITLVHSMIQKKVDSITIAANDSDALQSVLMEAMEAGIMVSTMDSNANADSRMTFVNQVSTEKIGKVLVDSVYDIAEGKGQWAILSTTNQATNQNEWIEAMKRELEQEQYSNLSLVDIVYGQDEYDASVEMTKKLIQDYPDLKVICAPTAVGIKAAAEVLHSMGDKTNVKVTGLVLPSQIAPYMEGGGKAVCPYMYLWNPYDVGRLSAYVAMALVNGQITGKTGDKFKAGDMGSYEIVPCDDGGTEVIVAPPFKFDKENIQYWKELF